MAVTKQPSREFVFIDARVDDLDTLLGGLVPGAQVHLLDPARDGLEQIAQALLVAEADGLSSISIVAHGAPGRLEIGPDGLDIQGVAAAVDALRVVDAALANGAALRLYACDLARGQVGQAFVDALSGTLGGRPVAASSRPVGRERAGDAWHLDVATRLVDLPPPFTVQARDAYQHILAVTFTKPVDPIGDTGSNNDTRVIFGDFDNDGDVDILYQRSDQASGQPTAPGNFRYKQNNGSGTFTDVAIGSSPFAGISFTNSQSTGMFVVDLDNDGRDDIVDRTPAGAATANFPAYPATQRVLLQNANGTFTQAATDPIGNTGNLTGVRVLFGDFDNDGDVDILYQRSDQASGATPPGNFGYKQNNGSGAFTDVAIGSSPFAGISFTNSQSTGMFVVDLNNDGRADIVERNPAGTANANFPAYPATLRVLLQNADGTFTQAATDPIGSTGQFPGRLTFGDFDSDGDVDILYQNGNTAGSGFGYKQNQGNGTFVDFPDATVAATPFAGFDFSGRQLTTAFISVVDLDKDGDVDIVDRTNNSTQFWQQGSNSGGDGSPPTLASSTPADNATGVSPSANITLTFDESVTKGTGNLYIVRSSDNAVIETIAVGSAQVTGSGTTWTINPNTTLAGLTGYAVRADSGIFKDADGAVFFGIGNNTTLNFTTGVANTAPSLSANAGSTVAEGGTDTITAAELSFTDAEQGAGAVTYTVTSAVTNGTLSKSGSTLGLGGTFTQADINNNRITFTHNGSEPASTSFGFSVSDGQGGTISNQTFTFNVTPVDDAPVVTAANGNATYTEDGAAASLFPALTLTDPDSPTFNRAVVTINDGIAGDTLSAGSASPFVANYTGYTLTLSGPGTRAELEAAIRTITYSSTSQDPNAGGTDNTRQVQVVVYDANEVASNTGVAGVRVIGQNDAPALTGTAAVLPSGVENDPYTVTRAQLLQGFTDVENDTLSLNTLSTNHGSIATTDGGLTYTITPEANYDGPVTISYNVSDGTANTPATLAFTLVNVVQGTPGDDVLASTAGPDVFRGLGSTDTASYANAAGPVTVSLLDPAQNTGEAQGDTYDSIENLTGSTFADVLSGNTGNNTLDGGTGADTLTGRGGNDSYIVDEAGDQVIETAGNGNADTVFVRGNAAFTSFTLAAGLDIEVLATTRAISTRPLDLTGNEKGQTIYGNAGANVLDGGGGADQMVGGAGADTFAFSTALGSTNVDRIVDFSAGDAIRLSKSIFAELDLGTLDADAFKDLGVQGATVDANDHVLYDGKGRLYYDADGAGGSDAVLFARVSYRPTLSHDDFFVV